MKTNLLKLLFIGFLCSISLLSCKKDDNELDVTTSNTISGTISNYTSNTYDEITGYDSGFNVLEGLVPISSIDYYGTTLGSCSIETDGSFSIKLSATSLTPINSVVTTGLTISDSKANLGGVGFGSFPMSIFMVSKSGTIVGGLYKVDSSSTESNATASLFLYSDREVTISGTTDGTTNGTDIAQIYHLTLKKGWNEVAAKFTDDSIEYSNTLPATMVWVYGSMSDIG